MQKRIVAGVALSGVEKEGQSWACRYGLYVRGSMMDIEDKHAILKKKKIKCLKSAYLMFCALLTCASCLQCKGAGVGGVRPVKRAC